MKCPECNAKMKCFLTSHIDNYDTYREYACVLCNTRYSSEEHLNLKPKNGFPKFVNKYYEVER